MKTRTLLLLSVAMGLLILLAGGVFLFQLSSQTETVALGVVGEPARLGDVTVTVVGATEQDEIFAVEIMVGGVDDRDGPQDFRLVTGDRQLQPIAAPDDGRCTSYTVEPQTCRLDFDVTAVASTSRVLVMRRGEDQRTWSLAG
ncbi:MAG: hypothetical protein ACR2O6_05645 [Ilumatobacteraceae bacterium]